MAARHRPYARSDHSTPIDVDMTHSPGVDRDRVSMDPQSTLTTLTQSFSIAARRTGASARMASQISRSICPKAKC